ncbi:hypothetical protein BGX24_006471 [Mortierella sp. AD032]|nr:hypothetical protein BGX24_006471 [Mortierella sp. AD032]
MSGKKVQIAQGGMRGEAKKTKVVFKNVLDTPFNIKWPEVTSDNNTIVLDTVCEMVKPMRDYHNIRSKQDAKPVKKSKKSAEKEAARSASSKPSTALATTTEPLSGSIAAELTSTPPPVILKSTILGINAITKALERSIQDLAAHPPPTAIIICKGDLIPSHLYAHLGPMIAMLPGVLLFPLLKGSERRLSEAVGLPAVGALAIRSTEGSREAEDLVMLLRGMVEPMTASWLPKVTPRPVAKGKTSSQPAAAAAESTASAETTGAGSESEPALAPATGPSTENSSKVTAKQKEFIPTNIKTIQTTMPIVVKTPKVTPVAGSNNNNKGKGQQQQPQQQQAKNQQQQQPKQQQNKGQSQNQNPKQKQQQQQQQADNQGKNKKPPVDNLDSDRGQGKKAKSN